MSINASVVMLRDIDGYLTALNSFAALVTPQVSYIFENDGRMKVMNDTMVSLHTAFLFRQYYS
jgi:hypothetical protein